MLQIIKFLGSLKVAIFLILCLTGLLIVSTVTESIHGTPFAQKVFYQATWFDLFLSLLWINIFCSTILRFPFKRHHTGFVVTHIGILILLMGALLSRLVGVEGQMTLAEGEHQHRIQQSGYALNVFSPSGKEPAVLELKASRDQNPVSFPVSGENFELVVYRFLENAVSLSEVKEGNPSDPVNHAVEVELSSQTVGMNEIFWLIEKDPANPHSSVTSMGPAQVELRVEQPKGEPVRPALRLLKESGEELLLVELTPEVLQRWQDSSSDQEEIPLPNSDLTLRNIRYYPSAKVEGNRLINAPDQILFNPAVEFEVHDSKGGMERHTKFTLFPDFDSLHGRGSEDLFGLRVFLDLPVPETARQGMGPSLVFSVSPEGQWTYRASSSKGSPIAGGVQPHQPLSTGWMDFTFTVHQTLDHAVVSRQVIESPQGGEAAAEIAIRQEGVPEQKQWILSDQPAVYRTSQGEIQVTLIPRSLILPFLLQLVDFRKVDYPGTQNAASFESDVSLHDMRDKTTIQKTISMNKPLDYAGFRIFQSSYIQDPSVGEASVFTVAKNPGITFIYSGAVILFTGVALLFYVKPLSKERSNGNADGD